MSSVCNFKLDHYPASAGVRGGAGQWVALHGAVLLFGLSGLFAKWVAVHPVLIVFGRVLVASAAFAILLRMLPARHDAPTGRQRWLLWGCGALLALHWVTFFQAIQVSTVAVGLLAYSTAPAFAALLEPPWLGERFSRRALGCALACLAGVALIVPNWALGAAPLRGVAWGLAAGLSFAVLSVLNRQLVRRHSALQVAFHQDLAALVLLAPLLPAVWQPLSVADVALLGVLGLACTALAHTLFIWALTAIPARTAAVASALEPVYGIALAWLLLDEPLAARTLAGGAVIVAAVLFATLRPEPAR